MALFNAVGIAIGSEEARRSLMIIVFFFLYHCQAFYETVEVRQYRFAVPGGKHLLNLKASLGFSLDSWEETGLPMLITGRRGRQ